MEQYNLSWTFWIQKMVLGKSRRHLRAATMTNHRCLRSSVCMCTHVHVCTHVHAWFQIKYVTRNKSYAKGKSMVVTTTWHDRFIFKPKLGWSLADGHKHSQSPVHWSKYKRCDGRPTGSKHKAYAVRVSRWRLLCLSLIGAYQNYVLCRLICTPINIGSTAKLWNKLLKGQRWVWRRFWWTYAVVDISYVFISCHAMQSRDACCEGV